MAYEKFIRLQSQSKTLRNSLIPIGYTEKHIQENGVLTEDSLRAEKREELKTIMDDYYRMYIEVHLKSIHDVDWRELFDAITEVKRNPTSDNKKKLEKAQEKKRKEIYQYLIKDAAFSDMFKEKMITGILPDFIQKNAEYSEEERKTKKKTVELFQRFTSSFGDFFKNRKNVFAKEAIATAIPYRIVHENAEIYFENMTAFQNIEKIAEDQIEIMEIQNKERLQEWKLRQIFSPDYYMMLMTQREIENYTELCGAINQYMREYCQREKKNWNPCRMKKLHKQILSKTASSFEIPRKYESDEEVYESVNAFLKSAIDKKIPERLTAIENQVENYDRSKIYITAPHYKTISTYIYGNWGSLTDALRQYYEKKITGKGKKKEENIKKAVKDDSWKSLAEIDELVNEYSETERSKRSAEEYIAEVTQLVCLDNLELLTYHPEISLMESRKYAVEMKEVLDKFLDLLHWIEVFRIEEAVEKDVNFYGELDDLYEEIREIVPLYNQVRNYVTQKPYSEEKIKLHFGISTLAKGWAKSKEFDYNAILLQKEEKYYLGILNSNKKPDKKSLEGNVISESRKEYKKMVYYYIPGAAQTLPRVLLKNKYQPSEEIVIGYKEGRHLKNNANFDLQFCHDLINYFKSGIERNPDWKVFGFQFSDTESYQDISGFYREVDNQGYKIEWSYIKEEDIDRLNEEGRLYLFQIYNKDFSEKSRGKENLHTMYLKNLFSEENDREETLRLNGGAEIFFRKSSVKQPIIHKKGTVLVNRTYTEEINGQSVSRNIPEKEYQEIFNYKNHRLKGELSADAKKYLEKAVCHVAENDIIKDYRYCMDKYLIHMKIMLNSKTTGNKSINTVAQKYIAQKDDLHIIGIDRGERNLIYVSVINQHGEIVEQRSLNIINNYNYKEKLKEREKSRDEARKNWKEIGQIKDLKEGYLSVAIHEIAQMMIKYNAIIAMEDLNYGFKRGRFKVERQIYQKFETMLIKKLSYLVLKERAVDENGGILKGYQLAYIPDSVKNIGRQCGVIFYVPAAFTSKIDPATGFIDAFKHKAYTTEQAKREFILAFDEICYDIEQQKFRFIFDYENFETINVTLAQNKWTIYTNKTRTQKEKINGRWCDTGKECDLTKEMRLILENANIEYLSGKNLLPELKKISDGKVFGALEEIIRFTVQLRNSKSEAVDEDYDRLISPVLNEKGDFFDSDVYKNGKDETDDEMPNDADANGAYCIALKGLYIAQKIKKNWNGDKALSGDVLKISNEEWFDYIQNKRYR